MADNIIQELWKIKDEIACKHNYDLDSFYAYLQAIKHSRNKQVINLQALKKIVNQGATPDGNSAALNCRR